MKQMRMSHHGILTVMVMLLLVTGCAKDDPDDQDVNNAAGFDKGVFILNEGSFGSGTGTITYLSRSGDDIRQEIYQKVNDGNVLGNIVQSMNFNPLVSENAFIVVSNADKIEVVNLRTFERITTIGQVPTPRYAEFGLNAKIYVSCWDDRVRIFNAEDLGLLGELPTGVGPEKMLRVENTIWILNQGGFSVDSTVTVINTNTDEVVHTLQVYPKPSGIRQDANGFVWILCSGNGWNGFPADNDTEGHLLCVDPNTYNLLKDIPFPTTSEHPDDLVINPEGDQLFYSYTDGIYRFDTHGSELEEDPFIMRNNMFYGLGLDPEAGLIYASDPLDYSQNGMVFRFSANNGLLMDSIQAGLIPGEFFFTPLPIGD